MRAGEGGGLWWVVRAPLLVAGLRGSFSGWGEGFLTMLPRPGRSERPDREGVALSWSGEIGLGAASMGMFEVGRAEMVISSTPLLFGLVSMPPYALAGPGEFSLLNEDGSLDRSGSLFGDP